MVQVTYRSCASLEYSKDGFASAIACYLSATPIPLVNMAFLLAAIEQEDAAMAVIYYMATTHSDEHCRNMPDVIPRIHRKSRHFQSRFE